MKNGTLYAGRLKKAYAKLRHASPQPTIPELDDPLVRLAVAILGVGSSDEEGAAAVQRAREVMVDWNEMRVSSAPELNQATGNVLPQGVQRCQQLILALQAMFDRDNRLSLDPLKASARREARHYLEELEGVDEYAVASVILWSLGGHAIPVNDRLLEALRSAELIRPEATRAEVQAFLERHISADEAREFCTIMRSFKGDPRTRPKEPKKKTAAKKKNVAAK